MSSAKLTSLPIREGEDPWTEEEIAEQREELEEEVARMEKRYQASQAELDALMKEGMHNSGRDSADIGSSHFERDQEMYLAASARELLEQCRLALRLFDEGQYGLCETCEQPIGKSRLQVFPRATMCVACKQREERQ